LVQRAANACNEPISTDVAICMIGFCWNIALGFCSSDGKDKEKSVFQKCGFH